ncbi:uncharacterized protein K460DRAFT_420031 [Cucurbitaria berberidis CBS 394.84]|uniref:SH3 domain-containing protein n=1 Tax=Cucurbitaria berberidis CBS 394.84 TaxID=1168544 RepID=A0A9P4GAJ8_9PLEO|nr:uncharacterized protein K460DRAFT_420031 [Cucurbitaria berberidis CBS 394.84]KAF1842072.1 hypothetical protein K460DRAFT_420031 [Cucurbitaria berberidis CBS 394.84]
MGGAAATEPPSVSLSFANNFWGKDDAGVGPMLDRMHAAKVTNDELKSFYAARGAIEEEYARKLLSLSKKPLGSYETGTVRLSCDVIRAEVESMGKAHQSIAQQMKTELEEPLAAFAGGMKERRKIVQTGIEKLLKMKMQQTATVNKSRDRYEQDCLKIKGFLAQAHMVMGHEERKNKARLEKTQINLSTTSSEYEAAVKVLEETTGRWNRDWKLACDKFQDLEEERIDYTKSSLWNFANIASTVCVSDDASCEKMRLSLEDCDVEKDITGFIKESGTGQEIPDPPKFINFCRGDAETSSQASEDENYSVAQFARTMNPAYRASSPAPSAFESHHDPNNPLARELGLQNDTKPISQDEINVPPRQATEPPRRQAEPLRQHTEPLRQHAEPPRQHVEPPRQHVEPLRQRPEPPRQHTEPPRQHAEPPRQHVEPLRQRPEPQRQHTEPPQPVQQSQSARGVQPDPRLVQAQEQARQNYQQSQVPHNDYPTDGMTQFCRIGAPSDRSTIPSPARPASRDSQSEYSNPTSFSSIEPPSGSASPGKPMPQSPFAEPSPIEESLVQKKRGFFNSPFARRKSKHEREPPNITPSSRNTWGGPAARKTTDENVSPTKQLGRGTRGTILHDAPRSASPEPVDPRANFQLNVGNNVFDVASPDKKKQQKQQEPQDDLDPIAQALEELRGVTKESSLRVSADRYHGLATPLSPGTPAVGANQPGGVPTPLANVAINAAKRGTPPPSYEQPPMSRLGAPKPAHTSRQMQKTTEMYVNQKVNMFSGRDNSRPPARSPTKQEPPRAASPAPPRATSPRPSLYTGQQGSSQNSYRSAPQQPQSPSTFQPAQRKQQPQSPSTFQPKQRQQQQPQSPSTYQPAQRQQQASPAATYNRTASPNPYAASNAGANQPAQRQQQAAPAPAPAYNRTASPNPYAASAAGTRPRAQTTTAPAQVYGTPVGRNSYSSTRGASPSVSTMPRAASPQPPQPTYAQSRPQSRAAPSSRAVSPQPQFRQAFDRPSSSRGSDMALQLSEAGSERGEGSVYGGSQRGRGNARPQSSYFGGGAGSEYNGGGGSSVRAESRVRSKSLAEPKNYNSQGRLILNYSRAMYSYAAQIPEELAFQKGDILAVLRLQDDGWWEAEAVGKNGRPGLVPSNYLQAC